MHVYIYEQLASLCGSPLASCIYKILIKIVARHNNAMRSPCCDKQGNNRGAWSKEEDQKLIDYIRVHGEVSWRSLPKAAGLLRCGKSCRLRWINYLRPDVKRGNFKEDEEDLIIKLHALLGNRWSLIAGRLPGRTDNEVKNYWNSHLRKKLKSKGIDPDNHRVTLRRPAERSGNASDLSTDVEYCSWPCAFSSATTLADQEMSSKRSVMNGLPDLNLDLAATCVPSKKSSGYNDETSDDFIAAGAACVDSSAGGGPASTTLLLFR